MGSPATPQAPAFKPATYTALDPASLQTLDPAQANAIGTQYDKQAYAASDADFAARHPDLVAANKINEANVLSEEKGNAPAGLEAQLTTAGLGTAANALATPIAPGSTGSFGVARNLGEGYQQYQSALASQLGALNQQDAYRTFGLSGSSAVNLALANDQQYNAVIAGNQQGENQTAIANATGQNASNQGGFAGALQAYSNQIASTNAGINAGVSAGAQLGAAGISAASKAGYFGTAATAASAAGG